MKDAYISRILIIFKTLVWIIYQRVDTSSSIEKHYIYIYNIYVVDTAHGNDYLGKKKVQANLPI